MTGEEIRAGQERYIFPAVGNYYREPLVLAAGNGKYLYDHDGRAVSSRCRLVTFIRG